MGRISGPLAFLAGIFLLLPGVLAMLDVGGAGLPAWLARDLLVTSLCGGALMVWGGILIRHRELALNDLEPIRIRARR
ncbi:MAG: hypothetical protein JSR81_06335 [Proteobacteria bacterium]|nr:hypothetical protein [Pseudomonadota bacterium]